jgi:hypothetical protein
MSSVPIYRKHKCERTHRTYKAWVNCAYRKGLCWIAGEGKFASFSFCGLGAGRPYGTTVQLYQNLQDALNAKRVIDSSMCGTWCHGRHRVAQISLI